MADEIRNYLFDLGTLLREAAIEAKMEKAAKSGAADYDFASGRAMAYYEVLSLMQQQAKVFDLDLQVLSLGGFDADKELLNNV